MILRGMIDPIPDLISDSRYELQLANRLGVPVTQVWDVPLQYITAARVDIAIDVIQTKKAQEAAAAAARKTKRK